MAEKTKIKSPDDDLAFNFDDFNFEEPKDGRKPSKAFGQSAVGGLKSGFKGKLTDPAMYREIYRDVLPPGYDRALTTVERLHSTVQSNAQYAKQQMAGPIKQAKSLVNQHVNKLDGKLPKGVVDTIKDWSKQQSSGRPSASELAEASLTNELNSIFGAQHAITQRDKDEAIVREAIADKKNDARHNDSMGAMFKLTQGIDKLVSYQDNITIGYQRKSLELQMRHYTAMLESINLNRQGTEVIVKNLQSIATNTRLPEFLKLKMSERAHEVMRTNFMNKTYDKVFGGTDFMGSLFNVLRKRGKQTIDDARYNFENALSNVDMLMGMSESMGLKDKNAAEKAAMGGDLVGDIAGSTIAGRLGKAGGNLIKRGIQKYDTEGKIAKGGRQLNYFLNNPSGAYEEFVKHLQGKKDKNTGESIMEGNGWFSKLLNGAKGFADDLRDEVNRGGDLSTKVGGIKNFGEVGQLTYGAVRSLEEIIPGYLQRITHNTAIMATGDPTISPVVYDFSKGQFVHESKKLKGISSTLFDSGSKNSLNYQGEQILRQIDPNNRLRETTKKKVLDILLADNMSNLSGRRRENLGNFDRLTKADTWSKEGVGKREAEYIAKVIGTSLGEAFSETHVKAADQINKYGADLAEKREAIQALINTGDIALLRRIGLVDENNNYSPTKYIELLSKDTIDFGVDDTLLGANSKKRKRSFKVGFREGEATPPVPGAPSVTGKAGGNVDINNAGVDAITSAINTTGDITATKLQEIIDLSKSALTLAAQQVSIVQYQFGLEGATKFAGKMLGKGLAFGSKAIGFGFKGVGKIATMAADIADWGRGKLDRFKDIYVAGINSPKLQAWKLQAGLYRDQVTDEVIKRYTDIKNAVIDENGNVVLDVHEIKNAFVRTPLGKKALTALGAGKSWLSDMAEKHPVLTSPLRLARSAWASVGTAKDNVLDFAFGQFDVFVKGEEVPRMTAHNMRLGLYRLATANTAVYKLKDITEDVVDQDGNVVLTLEDLPKAYYNSPLGRKLLSGITGIITRATSFAGGKFELLGKAKEKLIDIVDRPMDIFVKDEPDKPRMLGITMQAGGYWCMVKDKAIMRPSQIVGPVKRISDGLIVITEEDIHKGLVDSKGQPLRSVRSKLWNLATSQITLAKNLAVKGFKWGKKILGKGISKLSGIFSDAKGIDMSGFMDWLTSNPVVDQLKSIYKLLDERMPGRKRSKTRKMGTVTDSNGDIRKIGDLDNDGLSDGSPEENKKQGGGLVSRMGKSLSEKVESAKKALEERKKKREEAKANEENKSGIWDMIKDNAGNLLAGAAGLLGLKAATGAGTAAAGVGAAQAATAGAAAATGTGAAAAGTGAVAAGAAATKTSMLRAGAQGAWWLTKNLLFKPTGWLLRGAVVALPVILSAVGAILSSPVTVPALAIAAAGYGIYKFATRLKIGNTMKMRMAQYGFSGVTTDYIKGVAEFEETIRDKVKMTPEGASLDKTDADEDLLKKIKSIFGMDAENPKHMAKFSVWYRTRFKPVYLAHLTALNKLGSKTSLRDIESLEPKVKIDYVQAVRGIQLNMNETQSPFPNHQYLEATMIDVNNYADKAIAEAKKEVPDAVVPPVGGKNPAEVNATKPIASNGVDTGQSKPSPNLLAATGLVPAAAAAEMPGANGTKITPSAKVVAEKENAKVGALDAVRFKTYGLVDLEPDKMTALRSAEDTTSRYLKNAEGGRLVFDGDLITLGTALAPAFGVNMTDTTTSVPFISWVKSRFLPTYLNYANALNAIAGRYNDAAKAMLSPADTYKTALAIRDSKNMDSKSVWSCQESPWARYTLNTDPSSVLANIEFLKETADKLRSPVKEEKINATAEKAKKIEEKAKATSTAPTPVNKPATSMFSWGNVVEKFNTAYAKVNYGIERASDAVSGELNGSKAGPATSSMGIKVNEGTGGKGDGSFASLIRSGESGKRGYNAYNRGSERSSPSNKENVNLTGMTIGAIMEAQARRKNDPQRLFAVGKYQMIPDTLREGVKKLGISRDELFTPELQERMFADYLAGVKRPAIGAFIRGKTEDPSKAINSASAEWAALQNTSGRGTYDKQGTNFARITADQVKAALVKARARYAELIKSGVSADKAYGMAIGAYADASAAGSATAPTGTTPGTTSTTAGSANATSGATGTTPTTTSGSGAPATGAPATSAAGTTAAPDSSKSKSPAVSSLKTPTPASASTPAVQSAPSLSTASSEQPVQPVSYTSSPGIMSSSDQLMKTAFGFNKMGSREQAVNQVSRNEVELNKPGESVLAGILAEAKKHTDILSSHTQLLTTMAAAMSTMAASVTDKPAPGTRPNVDFKARAGAMQLPVDMSTSGLI